MALHTNQELGRSHLFEAAGGAIGALGGAGMGALAGARRERSRAR